MAERAVVTWRGGSSALRVHAHLPAKAGRELGPVVTEEAPTVGHWDCPALLK